MRVLDALHRHGRFRDEVRLSLAAVATLGLTQTSRMQATAAAIAIGNATAARRLCAEGLPPTLTQEATTLCDLMVAAMTQARNACDAQQWLLASKASEGHPALEGILPLQLIRAVALHHTGQTSVARGLLDRLAFTYPFEVLVRQATAFVERREAAEHERAVRSLGAYRRLGGIAVIAAAGSFAFLQSGAGGEADAIGPAPAQASPTVDVARVVALALSATADSLAELEAELNATSRVTPELARRLSARTSELGRRNYLQAQVLLASGDTATAAAKLASAAAAGTDNYWVDDALYQLMNILHESGRHTESRGIAQRIITAHASSVFNNSRSLLISQPTTP